MELAPHTSISPERFTQQMGTFARMRAIEQAARVSKSRCVRGPAAPEAAPTYTAEARAADLFNWAIA